MYDHKLLYSYLFCVSLNILKPVDLPVDVRPEANCKVLSNSSTFDTPLVFLHKGSMVQYNVHIYIMFKV